VKTEINNNKKEIVLKNRYHNHKKRLKIYNQSEINRWNYSSFEIHTNNLTFTAHLRPYSVKATTLSIHYTSF